MTPCNNQSPHHIGSSCVHNSTHYLLVTQACSPLQQLIVCLGLAVFWLSFNIYIWFQWNNCYICTCRVYDKHIWLKTVLYQIFLILYVSSCWKCWYWLQCLILGHLKSCRWPVYGNLLIVGHWLLYISRLIIFNKLYQLPSLNNIIYCEYEFYCLCKFSAKGTKTIQIMEFDF